MKAGKFLQAVTFETKLARARGRGAPRRLSWESRPCPKTKGILIGIRTLADGTIEWTDEGWIFYPSARKKAGLVAFDIRRRPVLVAWEDLVEAEA